VTLNARIVPRLLAAVVVFCSAAHAEESESQRFRAFLDHAYERVVQQSPILASEFGERVGEDRWDDSSEAGLAADAKAIRDQLDAVKTQFKYDELDAAGKLQYRVFVNESQLLLDRYRWRDEFYPLNQIVGLHVEVPDVLINQQRLDNVPDARTYIERIAATRTLFAQLTTRMSAQAVKGIYMPRSVYPLLIAGSRNVITGAPFDKGPDSAIFADFKRRVGLLSVPEQQKARLVNECRAALLNQLGPRIQAEIQKIPGVVDTKNGVDDTISGPATNFQVDPIAAARLGFTPSEVAEDATAVLDGLPAADPMIVNGRPYTVRVRLPAENRASLEAMKDTVFNSSSGHVASLGSLADVTQLPPQGEILRENLQRMIAVTGRQQLVHHTNRHTGRELRVPIRGIDRQIVFYLL